MGYRIEKAGSGWNIFESEGSGGKQHPLYIEGPYERAYAIMLELSYGKRLLRESIVHLKKRRIRLKVIRKAIYIDVDNPWMLVLHPPKHEGDRIF